MQTLHPTIVQWNRKFSRVKNAKEYNHRHRFMRYHLAMWMYNNRFHCTFIFVAIWGQCNFFYLCFKIKPHRIREYFNKNVALSYRETILQCTLTRAACNNNRRNRTLYCWSSLTKTKAIRYNFEYDFRCAMYRSNTIFANICIKIPFTQ